MYFKRAGSEKNMCYSKTRYGNIKKSIEPDRRGKNYLRRRHMGKKTYFLVPLKMGIQGVRRALYRWRKPLQKSSSTPHYDVWRRLETSLQDVWATHGRTFSTARKTPVLLDTEAAQTPGRCFKESRVQKCGIWINFNFSRFCQIIIQQKITSSCNKITCNCRQFLTCICWIESTTNKNSIQRCIATGGT